MAQMPVQRTLLYLFKTFFFQFYIKYSLPVGLPFGHLATRITFQNTKRTYAIKRRGHRAKWQPKKSMYIYIYIYVYVCINIYISKLNLVRRIDSMTDCVCSKLYTHCPHCGLSNDMWPPTNAINVSDCATLLQLQRRMTLYPNVSNVKVHSTTYQYKYKSLDNVPEAYKSLYNEHGYFVCGLS